jgi:hypothetical protein
LLITIEYEKIFGIMTERVSYNFGRYWIDFLQEVISEDKENQTLIVSLEADPRKYEWRKVEGLWYLYDRHNTFTFSEAVFNELARRVIGEPVYREYSSKASLGDNDPHRIIVIKMRKTLE